MFNVKVEASNIDKRGYSSVAFGAKPINKELAMGIKANLLSSSVRTADLFCHATPDEDAFNSLSVIKNWLKRNGKEASICLKNAEVKGLFGAGLMFLSKKKTDEPADRSIILDFNDTSRFTKTAKKLFEKIPKDTIFGFDHHRTNATSVDAENLYIDDTAKSCCGVVYRFFEALEENIPQSDRKKLFCGMISDYKKSGLIKVTCKKGVYNVEKTEKLCKDENSLEVFEKLQASLSEDDKIAVYKHLDVLANMPKKYRVLRDDLLEDFSFCLGKRLAYMYIPADSISWRNLGMDNSKTSELMKDLRNRVLSPNLNDDETIPARIRKNADNLKAVISFYRVSPKDDVYQMSITSKDGYALKLINYVKDNLIPDLEGGGHANRAGARVRSLENADIFKFMNSFMIADEELAKLEAEEKNKQEQ